MVGLSPAFSGVIQDTASTSTLVALICARERATNYALARGGLQGEARTPLVYVSAHAHSSVDKGALLAGFGRENLRLVPFDEPICHARRRARGDVEADLAKGEQPCALVATIGTTASTAIDPVAPIAEVARRHGLWLHVDAAMAGTAMILPECRGLWRASRGRTRLCSIAHKWLGAPFDCSVYYVRDPEHLVRVMSTNPSFLQSSADGAGDEPPRLGHPARPPLPGAQTLDANPRTGRHRTAGAVSSRHDECAVARRRGRLDAGLARGRAGSVADGVRPARARGSRASRSTRTRGRGSSAQSLGRRLCDAGRPRWPLDGPGVDRRAGRRRKRTSPRSGRRCGRRRRHLRRVPRGQRRLARPSSVLRGWSRPSRVQ